MVGSSIRSRRASGGGVLRDLALDGEGALHGQIYRGLREAVLSGRAPAGTRLPTTRALALELGLSRNTVVAAFEALRAEGYVVAGVGAGTFVAPQVSTRASFGGRAGPGETTTASPENASAPLDASPATRRPKARGGARTAGPALASGDTPEQRLSRHARVLARQRPRRLYDAVEPSTPLPYDFRPCVPDLERLSYADWRRALARGAWSVPSTSFDYGEPAGLPALREEIVRYLARARGVACRAEEVVVVSGLAQALDLATRLLVDPGQAVLVEDPHYLGARRAFEAAGAALVGAPVDAEGLDLSRVDGRALTRCRLAYVTPSHQFPTGAVLSLARRQALLAWAERANAFILEDDYDSEFRYAGRAIPALKSLDAGERVLYVGTFSKTLLPGLRLAYVVVPRPLFELYRTAKWLADWSSPGFEQTVLARFLASGEFDRHLRRARTCYAASRSALIDAIDEWLAPFAPTYHDSRAGLHLLLRFPALAGGQAFTLTAAGRARGLGLYPAAPCALAPEAEPLAFVMGFARLAPDAVRAGVRLLAELLGEAKGHEEATPIAGAREGPGARRRDLGQASRRRR